MPAVWKSLPDWGRAPKRPKAPPQKTTGVTRIKPIRRPSYAKIKLAVMEAVAQLSQDKQRLIPMQGTLPEIMVALALIQLNWQFQAQSPENGARLRLGGSVVDFVVFMGATKVIIRVQGDYWHALPGAPERDAMQEARLESQGYRVVDLWEQALYLAWETNNLRQLVEAAVLHGR